VREKYYQIVDRRVLTLKYPFFGTDGQKIVKKIRKIQALCRMWQHSNNEQQL
jgi:hypothetical protein